MARKLRVQYPGALYHLLSRGDRREPIFKDDADRSLFLDTLTEACAKTGWQVHAYCLMPNHFHLVIETPAPNLVAGMKWLLGEHGIPKDTKAGRRYFVAAMEARRQGEQVQAFKAVRRGWCLGNKAFRKELLAQMKSRPGPNDYGEERYESDEARAEELLAVELKRRGWKPQDLLTRRKGDKGKVLIAARLRQDTTMTLKWLAERLEMGSASYVYNLLAAHRRTKR